MSAQLRSAHPIMVTSSAPRGRTDLREAAMHDLLIIGGGPAGLAAAAYGLGKQLDVVLLCADFGGKAGARQQFADQVEPEHLVGEESFQALQQTVAAQPNQIVEDYVIGVFKRAQLFHVLTEHTTLHAPAMIIATGARPTQLGIAHENELIGHGLSYSIATHAHLAAGRDGGRGRVDRARLARSRRAPA